MNRSHSVHLAGILAISVTAVALSGCASGGANASAPAASAVTSIENCGVRVPVGKAPERVVTIKSTTLELLLALGVGDRVIGQAFSDGPVPEQWKDEAAKVPVISTNVPGKEALLELEPDMVYAGWESNVSDLGAGDRAELASLGVRSYVSPSACKEAASRPAKLTFDDVWSEIDEAGTMFDATQAAQNLIEQQRVTLGALKPVQGSPSALWYSSGGDTPYVGAGSGAPEMMMEAAGLKNIAASINDTWASYNWEAVAEANPSVIVVIDSSWSSAAKKIDRLTTSPATSKLDAVKNRRFVILPFATSEAGVRNVDAVAAIVAQVNAFSVPAGK